MPKLDLHTHSIASPDGGLTAEDYRLMLDSGGLQAIAVTDHDTIEFAAHLRKQLGSRVIVGQEITTSEGEIIGLFLKRRVEPRLSPEQTVQRIHDQGGLVYVPHPFETIRSGLRLETLNRIAQDVDIIEIHNGRAYFQNQSAAAAAWAKTHQVGGAASSDAHGWIGWGKTFTSVSQTPARNNLAALLKHAEYALDTVGFRGIFYPKLNRLRKRFSDA